MQNSRFPKQYTSTTNPNEELFDYDEDGNMTGDGTFEYTWNGENRLIQVEPKTAASGDLRLTFSYDFMGRRVQKVVETYDASRGRTTRSPSEWGDCDKNWPARRTYV